MLVAGIDIGSITTEALLFDKVKGVVGYTILQTGADSRKAAEMALDNVLATPGKNISDLSYIISTGCGRKRASFAKQSVTEITCIAKGVNYLFPDARTIIDIGGQDTKVIRIDGSGRVLEFEMNDKCAAGTGRFLSAMAAALGMDVDELSGYAEGAVPHRINSMCTVFAESEVIGLINQGISRESIIAGLDASIARRTASMVGGLRPQPPIAFSGGVARNADIVKKLEEALGQPVIVPSDGIFAGALGAALICREQIDSEESCIR